MNRTVLAATMVERGATRYTPAGIPACDLSLKHESQQLEAGSPRKVSMEIRAVALGEVAQRLARLEIGSSGVFSGFLTAMRNGRGTVFHVTEFE